MNGPSYICVGAQKCGTSSLKFLLNNHPDIYCFPREIHYFDRKIRSMSETEYKAKFTETTKPITGEKTPSYCVSRTVLARIAEFDPHVKIIMLVREPVGRIWSQHNMAARARGIPNDARAVNGNNLKKVQRQLHGGQRMISRSQYGRIIRDIYDLFPRNQVLVVVQEELIADPTTESNRIAEFLGVSPYEGEVTLPHVSNGGYTTEMHPKSKRVLRDHLREDTELFYRLIGRRVLAWDAVHDALERVQ